MKRFLIFAFVFIAMGVGALGALFASPYYFYNKIVSENFRSKWYYVENYREDIIKPDGPVVPEEPNLGNEDLWQSFHLRDTLIPLPVRNPLYYVAPLLSYDSKSDSTRIGVAIYGTGYREISKLYFVNNMLMGTEIRSQELFKLPLARKIIQSASSETIWRDIFKKDLSAWNIPFSEMVYNLYILQLRSRLLPKDMVSFGALNEDTGIARLKSENKDYITELVMTRNRGVVYSYIIVTEKNNSESEVLRYKFLREISFRPGSEALAGILYKEFKALPYERQVDHEGMLYLLSAWSHKTSSKEYLKELIFYLERGEDNQTQLKPLYEYASLKHGKVFAQKLVDGVGLESKMRLKRDIELEEKRERERLKSRSVGAEQKALSPEEKIKNRIEEAKKRQRLKKSRMILD